MKNTSRVYELAATLFERFSGVPAEAATQQLLTVWEKHLRSDGKSTSTIRVYLYAVRRQCTGPVLVTIPATKTEPTEHLGLTDLRRLIASIPLTSRGLHDLSILLSVLSGMKFSELQSLRWVDIAKLPPTHQTLLKTYFESKAVLPQYDCLIFSERGESWRNLPSVGDGILRSSITITEVNRRFRSYAIKAKIDVRKISTRKLRMTGKQIMKSHSLSSEQLVKLFLPDQTKIQRVLNERRWIHSKSEKDGFLNFRSEKN